MSTQPFAAWRTPAGLWGGTVLDPSLKRLMEPALFRFVGPAWPTELMGRLATDPPEIASLVAANESATNENAGWYAWHELPAEPLKLFQPTQNRSYVAACSIVSLTPGLPPLASLPMPPPSEQPVPTDPPLPDEVVEAERKAAELEWRMGLDSLLANASMVIRRLIPLDEGRGVDPADPVGCVEFGWVGRPGKQAWRPVPWDSVDPDEERHPAFKLDYKTDALPRQLHAAVIPVGNRERYLSGPVDYPSPWPPLDWDPRLAQFRHQVAAPLERLAALEPCPQAAGISAMVWLDFASFLRQHLPWLVDQIHFRPPWALWLEQVWEQRVSLLAGMEPEPPFSLAGAVTQNDVAVLTDLVGAQLLADRRRRAKGRPASATKEPLFVARFALEGPASADTSPQPGPQLVSAPTRPFALAAHGEAGAPSPPPGEESGGAELLLSLLKMMKPSLPKLKQRKKESTREETSTGGP